MTAALNGRRRAFIRRLWASTAALGAAIVLAGCADGPAADEAGGTAEETELVFTLWGGDVEMDAFRAVADDFEADNPGVTVVLDQVPFDSVRERIDTGLAAGEVPDVFRVTYQDLGAYSSEGVLHEMTDLLDDDFLPAFSAAVNYEGTGYAIPHHTDTSAIIYRADLMDQIGVEPPTSLEDAWTWDEFIAVSERLQAETDADYGFLWNFQQAGAYRWLSLLYQAGGQVANDDFTAAEMDSPEARKALEFTKSWFDDGIVPPNSSLKTSERGSDLFPTGAIAMAPMGNWEMADIDAGEFDWGVTFLPQDVAAATELGGNALAVPAEGKNPELAARFAAHVGSVDAMREFVSVAGFLPVRSSLSEESIEFAAYAEQMQIFTQQATTMPEHLVRAVTHPRFSVVNQALLDEVDLALVGGQDVDTTLERLQEVIEDELLD